MTQDYNKYTKEDKEVWELLYSRQHENLQGKSCDLYIECLDSLYPAMNKKKIPEFDALNQLLAVNGWSIEVVKGLIPVVDFFELLHDKRFPSSTWLRKLHQLDYLEEPDMFHDIFGHIPLFMNEEYANFMQQFGSLGVQFKNDNEIIKELQRFYWFTIEFGVMKEQNKMKIYGAGIISSYQESNEVIDLKHPIYPYDLRRIIHTDFCTSEIQSQYYIADSLGDIYQSLAKYENMQVK